MLLTFQKLGKIYIFMVRLKYANDEKSTTWGREFNTFITLSLQRNSDVQSS